MAATAANVSDVEIDDAEGCLRWYFPVPEASYGFCSACGSSLFWKSSLAEQRMSICAGVLDPLTDLKTVQAWWVSEASDYHERPDVLEFLTE